MCETQRLNSMYYTFTCDVPDSNKYIEICDKTEKQTIVKYFFDESNRDSVMKEVEERLKELRSKTK